MANITLLPTLEQTISISVDKAEAELIHLYETRSNDEYWSEKDIHIDNAVELVIEILSSIKQKKFSSQSDFIPPWFQLMSLINLCADELSRKDTYYFQSLQSVVPHFMQAAALTDFMDLKLKRKSDSEYITSYAVKIPNGCHSYKHEQVMENINFLPTMQQIAYLFLIKAERELIRLCEKHGNDRNCNDDHFDIDNTIQLAIEILRFIKQKRFSRFEDFIMPWLKLMSILNLCEDKLSSKDNDYFRELNKITNNFSIAIEIAEFINLFFMEKENSA